VARQSMGPPAPPTNPASQQQSSQQISSRKPSGEQAPATPLASVGPPNFSYGSATHALPRKISLADTNMSIFAAMNKAAKDARERDIRAGKTVPADPEGQHPLVRFYEESLEEIHATPVNPPKIKAIRDDPPRRNSPRRSTRNARKSVERDESIDSDMRRTPTPTPSEGTHFYIGCVNNRIGGGETYNACFSQRERVNFETSKSCKVTKSSSQETCKGRGHSRFKQL